MQANVIRYFKLWLLLDNNYLSLIKLHQVSKIYGLTNLEFVAKTQFLQGLKCDNLDIWWSICCSTSCCIFSYLGFSFRSCSNLTRTLKHATNSKRLNFKEKNVFSPHLLKNNFPPHVRCFYRWIAQLALAGLKSALFLKC